MYLTKASSLQEYTVGQKISGSRDINVSISEIFAVNLKNLQWRLTIFQMVKISHFLFWSTVLYILDQIQILSENVPILLFDVLHIKGLSFLLIAKQTFWTLANNSCDAMMMKVLIMMIMNDSIMRKVMYVFVTMYCICCFQVFAFFNQNYDTTKKVNVTSVRLPRKWWTMNNFWKIIMNKSRFFYLSSSAWQSRSMTLKWVFFVYCCYILDLKNACDQIATTVLIFDFSMEHPVFSVHM